MVPQITAPGAGDAYLGVMNRLLLILNVAAAGSIMATKSSAMLAAISPYGHRSSPAPAVAPAAADDPSLPLLVTSFVCPTPPLPASLALAMLN